MIARIVLLLAGLVALRAFAAAPAGDAARFDFGEAMQGAVIRHEFLLRNDSAEALRIGGVELSTPLRLERMPAIVAPGGSVAVRVSLDTARLKGAYEGKVVMRLAGDAATERVFRVAGTVVPPIEVVPLPALFVATVSGHSGRASVTLVNREEGPIDIRLAMAPPLGDVKLEPLDAGRRYALTIEVPPDATPGRRSGRIELVTSSARVPRLAVTANVLVQERVHTFPDEVDLGTLHRRDLQAAGMPPNALSQTLMVYQADGRDFAAAPHADPGLVAQYERARSGDRVQLTVSLPADTPPGAIDRPLLVETNDPEFPILSIPVRGLVLPD